MYFEEASQASSLGLSFSTTCPACHSSTRQTTPTSSLSAPVFPATTSDSTRGRLSEFDQTRLRSYSEIRQADATANLREVYQNWIDAAVNLQRLMADPKKTPHSSNPSQLVQMGDDEIEQLDFDGALTISALGIRVTDVSEASIIEPETRDGTREASSSDFSREPNPLAQVLGRSDEEKGETEFPWARTGGTKTPIARMGNFESTTDVYKWTRTGERRWDRPVDECYPTLKESKSDKLFGDGDGDTAGIDLGAVDTKLMDYLERALRGSVEAFRDEDEVVSHEASTAAGNNKRRSKFVQKYLAKIKRGLHVGFGRRIGPDRSL